MLQEREIFGKETQHNIFLASVDTETTGLDISTATMLTCGIVRAKLSLTENPSKYANNPDIKLHELGVCGMTVMKMDLLYFCPPDLNQIPEEVTKINKLTMEEMVKHRDEFQENLAKIASLCSNYFLLMKNKTYDTEIIRNNLLRYGVQENVLNGYIFDEQDTVSPMYKVYLNTNHRGTLKQHVQMFDPNAEVEFHTALEDAKATLWCEWKAIEQMQEKDAEQLMKEL